MIIIAILLIGFVCLLIDSFQITRGSLFHEFDINLEIVLQNQYRFESEFGRFWSIEEKRRYTYIQLVEMHEINNGEYPDDGFNYREWLNQKLKERDGRGFPLNLSASVGIRSTLVDEERNIYILIVTGKPSAISFFELLI